MDPQAIQPVRVNPLWIAAALGFAFWLFQREGDRLERAEVEGEACARYLARAADWIEEQGGDYYEVVEI